MLRWLGFLLLVVVVHRVLTWLPVVGPFLARFGIFGFWISAIAVGLGLQALGRRAYRAGRLANQVRDLEAVDSPRNRGKLGRLHAANGRPRRARPLLEAAVEGEPESPEWKFQLGRVQLALGDSEAAAETLGECVAASEEHGYGQALLRLAEAQVRSGDYDSGIRSLERFEHNHGESPESAYRRGDALRRAGRKEEARRAFGRVPDLAESAPRYQRTEARAWALRARLASLF